MRNCIKADILRVQRKKGLIIMSIIIMLIIAIAGIVARTSGDKGPDRFFLILSATLGFNTLMLGIPVFNAVLGDDFKSKSMQTAIGHGLSRDKLILARLIEIIVIVIEAYIVFLLGILIFGLIGGVDMKTIGDTIQTILDEAGNGEDVDLNNSAAADLTQQILESRNATWTISKCELNIGFGDNKPTPRDNLDMQFSGYNTTEKNTLRLVNITLLCDITKNTDSKTTAVSGGTIQLSAKADDKLYGNVFVVDPAQDGFKVKAYRVIGNAAEEVSNQLSDITTEGFLFTVPKNETEANVVYRLEVYPTNGPDLVAKIEVTVDPTKEDESEENKEETDTGDPTKQKDDKPSEGTTEATTQATTESTTESKTEATSESTTEKPADTASPGDATSTD